MEYENFLVKELSNDEMEQAQGGIIVLAFLGAALLGGFIYDCISDPKTCIQGFKDGYNSN